MPLNQFTTEENEIVSNRGTCQNGSLSTKCCSICYKDSGFVEPSTTLQQMLLKSTNHMVRVLGFPAERARQLALSVIPELERWQSNSEGLSAKGVKTK